MSTAASHSDPYLQLRAMVVHGRLAPGARVSESAIAELLGVSRTPVREAMRRLQLEGLLVPDGGGARPRVAVAPLDPREAREVYRTAGVLEGLGGREVAYMQPAARRELVAELRELDENFRRATRARAPEADRLFRAHHAFHARLARAAAGPVILALLDVLRPRLERYEWSHGPLLGLAGVPFEPTWDEHAAIIDAVRDGDADAIESAVRGNWENAAERLAAAIEGAGGPLKRQVPERRGRLAGRRRR